MPSSGDVAEGERPGGRWVWASTIAAFVGLGAWLAAGGLGYAEPGESSTEAHVVDALAPRVDTGAATAGASRGGSAEPASGGATGNAGLVDANWADTVSARTGIPVRALRGYAGAEIAMRTESPDCHLGWSTLAALGHLESGHGTHAGSALDERGIARPGIFGPDLDGREYDAIDDTDAGMLDGSAEGDRAVGPMQFIPSTWAMWGSDGNNDGTEDPQQIDDAALAAARYVCNYGDLSDAATWRTAIFAYNHVESYVNAVAEVANGYAHHASG